MRDRIINRNILYIEFSHISKINSSLYHEDGEGDTADD